VSTETAGNGKADGAGAPKDNANALKHGLYGLMALRKKGKPNGRTTFGKAFRASEQEYISAYGGDPSPMQARLITDTVWCDFYIIVIDNDLMGKRLHRKGRPHPLLDIRLRIRAHRRENLKTLGLKRVAKTLTVSELLNGHDEQP
jgi:hypothetical protein